MKTLTLQQILSTQDMGKPHIEKICVHVANGTYDANNDPLTAIIANAYTKNANGEEIDSFLTDLDYAIDSLKKAKRAIKG